MITVPFELRHNMEYHQIIFVFDYTKKRGSITLAQISQYSAYNQV